MDYLEKLDEALKLISEKGNCDGIIDHSLIVNELKDKGLNIGSSTFVNEQTNIVRENLILINEIIYKLEKDELIRLYDETNEFEIKDRKYFITVEGRIFMQNGGYQEKKKRESTLNNLQLLMTVVIAVGTGLAGLYSLGKFLLWCFHHFCK